METHSRGIGGRFWAAGIAVVGLLYSQVAPATITPVNLNDFFADPTVSVAPDGSSAVISEDLFFSPVLLSNEFSDEPPTRRRLRLRSTTGSHGHRSTPPLLTTPATMP